MPSKSAKQHRMMEAVKHNPKFAKKAGIPQGVGRDFVAADKRGGRDTQGGSVLGALAGARKPAMRPVAAVRKPDEMLRSADRAISSGRDRLRKLKMKGS